MIASGLWWGYRARTSACSHSRREGQRSTPEFRTLPRDRSMPRSDDDEEDRPRRRKRDDDEERPRRGKKKSRDAGGPSWVLFAGLGGGLLALAVVVVVVIAL